MPLSEHEQRVLEQIERALYAEDPKFAATVRGIDPKARQRRRYVRAGIGVLIGLALLPVGIAIGSVIVNRLLDGRISAKYAPASVIAMGGFVVAFSLLARTWVPAADGHLYSIAAFVEEPRAIPIMLSLAGIAITGGMFVVPLYAFLTTTVPKSQAARTVAANNIVNSGAMVGGSILAGGLSFLGVDSANQLLLAAAMCVISAWLGWLLHKACDDGRCADGEVLPPTV